jgi:hypothetical protein
MPFRFLALDFISMLLEVKKLADHRRLRLARWPDSAA